MRVSESKLRKVVREETRDLLSEKEKFDGQSGNTLRIKKRAYRQGSGVEGIMISIEGGGRPVFLTTDQAKDLKNAIEMKIN